MKAIFLTKIGDANDCFELREVAKPTCGDTQLLIKVEGFGLNFADVLARKGLYRDCPPLPCVLGYEVVGRVVVQGDRVKSNLVGARVVAFTRFGGYAEYAITDSTAAVIVTDAYPADKALALATQYTTAYYSIFENMQLRAGDRILVHAAAGGVGLALCQLALKAGCEVFGTASSAAKLDLLHSIGVQHPINYRKASYPKVMRTILKGQRLDASFNSLAGQSVRRDLRLLTSGGKLVIFGAASRLGKKGGALASLLLLLRTGLWSPLVLLMQSKSIIGVNMLRVSERKPMVLNHCLRQVVKLAENGEIDPIVRYRFDISEIGKAHRALEKRSTIGKVVVFWNS